MNPRLSVCLLVLALHAGPLRAQEALGAAGTPLSGELLSTFVTIGMLSLVPVFLICCTCLTFSLIVFSICRQAIGLQQSPPNLVLISISLALTYFVMAPEFETAWAAGIAPFLDGSLALAEAAERTAAPFRAFMAAHTEEGITRMLRETVARNQDRPPESVSDFPLMVTAFLLSEISRAFLVGFFLIVPFLVIDLVVAAILMSMGMMMVPPAVVSLPFKLAFFVVANGWAMLTGSIISRY
ncbi:flagellar type III secretion system pore protein FliP [Mangrovicoccus algicola]|uniref:Flagellar biosynthetic protein FliP n=1 Tax=Mangrovicoccus algicola TaxID=2771008 RepID=A0A8J6YYM5_9RHOB|nr:flagellar type III secretion system pore protein FliP [Mangrovicoccus algicola]MBE3638406.1 EscR/YscR/HrcR family type III secretion system export apparatus protein [Mangrovicoccus algicola]